MRFTFLPLLIVTMSLGCQSGESSAPVASIESSSQSTDSDVAASGPIGPGVDAPELNAEGWINGNPPSKEQLAGKVVVIDTWAYW